MYRTLSAVGGGAADSSWQVQGTTFELRRCPTDTNAGSAVFTKEASDCIADGTAIRTTIRSISLIQNRNTVLMEARTTVAGKESVATSTLIVPQWQHSTDSVCRLEVNGTANTSIQAVANDPIEFRFSFTPVFVSEIVVTIDGISLPITSAQIATSPLVLSRSFPGNPAPYVVSFRTIGGPVPCEATSSITIGVPPPACRWSDPNYSEDMDIIGCNTFYQNPRTGGISTGVLRTRIGANLGVVAHLATHSANSPECLAADACRLITIPNGRLNFDASVSNQNYCQANSRGTLPRSGNPHAYILAMFESSGGRCQTKIVLGRNSVDGCLLPSAQIQMADGSRKRIDQIGSGDFVWNPVQRRSVKVASLRRGIEREPLIKITTGSHSISVTKLHPMRTQGGVKPAKDLLVGDFITLRSMSDQKITDIQTLPLRSQEFVWNLILDTRTDSQTDTQKFTTDQAADESSALDGHYFIADGFTVGDWFIQSHLAKQLENPSDEDSAN